MSESPSGRTGIFYGYIVVGIALIILAASYGARSAFGIFFKPMSGDFGWSRAMTSGAFSVSLVIEGLTGVVMGGLNDRLGPRLVLTICGVLIGLGFFLMSIITELWQFYLFYGLVIGIGAGSSFVPLVSTVARWFVKRRTLMTGITVSGIGVGTLLLPPLANQLVTSYDWRKSYIIMGALILVIVVTGAWFLRRDPAQKGEEAYGAQNSGQVFDERIVKGYSLREAVLTRQFWMLYLMLFSFGFTVFSFNPHFVPHVTDLGISAGMAALIVSVTGGTSIIGSILLGNMADRIGNAQVFTIGFLGQVVYFSGLVPARELWMLFLLSVVASFTAGGAGSSESPLAASLFGLRSHGLIYGVVGTGFTLGAAVGPYLTGYIYDVRDSYNMALITGAVIGILGLVMSLLLGSEKNRLPARNKKTI